MQRLLQSYLFSELHLRNFGTITCRGDACIALVRALFADLGEACLNTVHLRRYKNHRVRKTNVAIPGSAGFQPASHCNAAKMAALSGAAFIAK